MPNILEILQQGLVLQVYRFISDVVDEVIRISESAAYLSMKVPELLINA